MKKSTLKPFLSILIIVMTMLTVVFVKMETRRLGYAVLKKTRTEKSLIDSRRELSMRLTRLTQPGRIERIALRRLDLKHAQKGQIVQLFFDKDESSSISRVQ
jgi:cell division protein FtsL